MFSGFRNLSRERISFQSSNSTSSIYQLYNTDEDTIDHLICQSRLLAHVQLAVTRKQVLFCRAALQLVMLPEAIFSQVQDLVFVLAELPNVPAGPFLQPTSIQSVFYSSSCLWETCGKSLLQLMWHALLFPYLQIQLFYYRKELGWSNMI